MVPRPMRMLPLTMSLLFAPVYKVSPSSSLDPSSSLPVDNASNSPSQHKCQKKSVGKDPRVSRKFSCKKTPVPVRKRTRGGQPQKWWRKVETVGVGCEFVWNGAGLKNSAKGTCRCKRLCPEGETRSYKTYHAHCRTWNLVYTGYQ